MRVVSGAYGPEWAPDGSRLLVGVDSSPGGKYAVDLENGRKRRVARLGGDYEWSPDGGSVAFADSTGIRLVSSDGRRSRRIVRSSASYVTWTPGGRGLAFVALTSSTVAPGRDEADVEPADEVRDVERNG